MKRSEMVNELRDKLEKIFDLDHVNLPTTEALLEFLEEKGMRPPLNVISHQDWVDDVDENDWEPE